MTRDICIVVQARLNSQRVPGKMLRPFADTTLLEILIKKLLKSKVINSQNIYLSLYNKELIKIAKKYRVNIFYRSKESSLEERNPKKIWEWHNKLPSKY